MAGFHAGAVCDRNSRRDYCWVHHRLYETGLPRLHHPLFALDRFARASQDGFLLALARPDDERERREAIDWLRQAGAASVWEVDT
jgi:hypothetical protein